MAASIAISIQDNATQNIKTIKEALKAFNKEADGLNEQLNVLNKTKAKIDIETKGAAKELKTLQKEYDALVQSGDTASDVFLETSKKLEEAAERYGQAKATVSLLNKEINSTTKSIQNLDKSITKSENRSFASGALKGFAMQMAAEQGTQLLQQSAQYAIGSFYGSAGGNIAGGAFSGALSGGTAGMMIGGPTGAAVGSLIGATAGAISGGIQNLSAEDDAFKSYIQEQVENVQSENATSLSNGSSLAAGREVDKLAFKTLLGENGDAGAFLSELIGFAKETPFQYEDLTSMSRTALTYGYDSSALKTLLTQVGDAGAALGMDASGMNSVMTGLGRMKSSGKTTLEYINLLQERGIDAIGYLAEAKGISKGEVYDGISKSLFDGAESAQIIAEAMGRDYSGSMDEISKTFQGLTSTLEDVNNELDVAMGEGYNDTRKKGIEEEIAFMEGEGGEMMKDAYRLMGEFEASLENSKEQMIRDAITSTMESEEYLAAIADEDGAKAGRLLAEAKIKAENEYNASEGAQIMLESEKMLIENVRADTALNDAYWNAGYQVGLEYSKGRQAGMLTNYENGNPIFTREGAVNHLNSLNWDATPYAYGINYVPYNGFRAELHEGERVLTAAENREYRKGRASINISGNNFTVREEADIDKIADAIISKIIETDLGFVG